MSYPCVQVTNEIFHFIKLVNWIEEEDDKNNIYWAERLR
jgi:hypothetical protein